MPRICQQDEPRKHEPQMGGERSNWVSSWKLQEESRKSEWDFIWKIMEGPEGSLWEPSCTLETVKERQIEGEFETLMISIVILLKQPNMLNIIRRFCVLMI